MHVGVEATTLRSPELGGVWRYTDGLIHGLAGLTSRHRYSLLFVNALKPWARMPPPRPPSSGMRVVEVRTLSNLLFTFVLPARPTRCVTASVESFLGAVDVFHSVNAAVLPQRAGGRVVTIHDLTCLELPQYHPWIRRTLFRVGIRRAAAMADAIIVPSAATRNALAARFPAAASKAHVVPEAHDAAHFAPLASGAIDRVVAGYGLKRQGYLLFVGNIEPRKNLVTLIAAYNQLRTRSRSAPVLVLAGGSGWKNRAIHEAAAASPFASDIRFLGRVPEPDLPAIINGALAFVYPSVSEGFGLPVLEAMACGTPVIASSRSSLPEVLGEAGPLVDPTSAAEIADAMAQMLEDGELRRRCSERGLARAREFSWERTARETIRVYEDVAGCRQTR